MVELRPRCFLISLEESLKDNMSLPLSLTYRRKLVIKQDNKTIESFPFPIKCHIVAQLLSYTNRKP